MIPSRPSPSSCHGSTQPQLNQIDPVRQSAEDDVDKWSDVSSDASEEGESSTDIDGLPALYPSPQTVTKTPPSPQCSSRTLMSPKPCLFSFLEERHMPTSPAYEAWSILHIPTSRSASRRVTFCGLPIVQEHSLDPVISVTSEVYDQEDLRAMHFQSLQEHAGKKWHLRIGKSSSSYEDYIERCVRRYPDPVQDEINDLLADRERASSNNRHNRAWSVVMTRRQLHRRFGHYNPAPAPMHRIRFWMNPKKSEPLEYFVVIRGMEDRPVREGQMLMTYKRHNNPWRKLDAIEEAEVRRGKAFHELDEKSGDPTVAGLECQCRPGHDRAHPRSGKTQTPSASLAAHPGTDRIGTATVRGPSPPDLPRSPENVAPVSQGPRFTARPGPTFYPSGQPLHGYPTYTHPYPWMRGPSIPTFSPAPFQSSVAAGTLPPHVLRPVPPGPPQPGSNPPRFPPNFHPEGSTGKENNLAPVGAVTTSPRAAANAPAQVPTSANGPVAKTAGEEGT
ncbi:hypothetical protein VTK73DRAFT_208 [Phialemonium thermophilum]|uniref:SET domain-containing protein n=1 Tax=Phialemonium thermophilum TaxID=223376 RepID=A0ABR3VWE4_9PEZI